MPALPLTLKVADRSLVGCGMRIALLDDASWMASLPCATLSLRASCMSATCSRADILKVSFQLYGHVKLKGHYVFSKECVQALPGCKYRSSRMSTQSCVSNMPFNVTEINIFRHDAHRAAKLTVLLIWVPARFAAEANELGNWFNLSPNDFSLASEESASSWSSCKQNIPSFRT